jgi:hypothetical protein
MPIAARDRIVGLTRAPRTFVCRAMTFRLPRRLSLDDVDRNVSHKRSSDVDVIVAPGLR